MSQHKLLLADDSVTVQKVVNLTFADEGIEVMTVGDGDSAMEKVAEFGPDLVLADVNMPGLSGYEVCERIKSNPETSRLPVILLVGSFEPFDEAEASRVGADDYLTKPFQSIRQLVNKVTDLLGAGQPKLEEAESSLEEAESSVESAEVPEPETSEFADTLEPGRTPESFEAQPSTEMAEAFEPIGDTSARTLELEAPPEPAFDYGDAGFDDDMIEASSAVDYSSAESDEDDLAKTQPLDHEELRELAFVGDEAETISNEPAVNHNVPEFSPASIPAPSFASAAPVRLDEVNPLDLPPLVEETGIRPAFFETLEPQTISEPAATARPVVTEEMVADIAARVADRLAERIARALDADVVREVTLDVLNELGETKD